VREMTYNPDAEPTHAIPKELEAKLVAARRWYNNRQVQVAAGIPDSRAWMDSDLEGLHLLGEIVEIIDETWGWGPKADRT